MKRRILTGATMVMLVAAVALMAALVSAHAQSSQIVADIPFDFTVGSKSLKAGEYTVRSLSSNNDVLLITGQETKDVAIRLTQSVEARKAPEKATLVFHRYGQRYFLSEVWTNGDTTGRRLRKSAEERAIEGQLAAIPAKSELARSSYERVEIVAMVR